MRPAFLRSLVELAERDERINLVVGDLGFGLVEPFMEKYPGRFLNIGVAEQNLIAVSTGMAMCGKVVFAYSIANFPTLRCLEQIRNDICHHEASVIVVSVGCGFNYGTLGVTHHATEDIALMRALPGMTVVAPGDPVEAALATRALAGQTRPAYLRLGKAGEPRVHQSDAPAFELGKAISVRKGSDVTLIATGTMLYDSVRAAERLAEQGIEARVLSMHTIKPLDADAVLSAARETRAIMTVEEHSVIGGLGSAVAETLAESSEARVPFKRLGIPSVFTREVGNQDHLKNFYSLSVDGILQNVPALLATAGVHS